MASTYSDLKIELIGTGEQVGTWGSTTNTNLGTAIEEAITGSADVTFFSSDITLALTNTNASQTARHLRLRLVGTSGGARNLTVPNIQKNYVIKNELADAVTIKNSTGPTVTVSAGTSSYVFSTGTGVEEVISTSLFIPPGIITMWSGSVATIPATWALCDGTEYDGVLTPDLTDKFIVGAGATYEPADVGGYTDAIVPSHTHSVSISDPGHFHYSRNFSSGAESPGYGLTLSTAFLDRVQVNTSADPTTTRQTASATTGISASTANPSGSVSDLSNRNLPPYYALAYIMKL